MTIKIDQKQHLNYRFKFGQEHPEPRPRGHEPQRKEVELEVPADSHPLDTSFASKPQLASKQPPSVFWTDMGAFSWIAVRLASTDHLCITEMATSV